MWRSMPLLQLSQDELPAVPSSGRPDLPEVFPRHALKVGAGGSKLRAMKDRLPPDKFDQDAFQFRIGPEFWLLLWLHATIIIGPRQAAMKLRPNCLKPET